MISFLDQKHIPTNALHLPGLDPNTELFHTAGLCTRSHSLAGKSSKLFRAFPFRSAQEPRNLFTFKMISEKYDQFEG